MLYAANTAFLFFGKKKKSFSFFSIFKHWKIILAVILIFIILLLIAKLADAARGGKILFKGVSAPFRAIGKLSGGRRSRTSAPAPAPRKRRKSEIASFDGEYDEYDDE